MKVSIILVCYNSGAYLKKSIDSVLTQSYNNLELIVVDDGSTDNTYDILKEYQSAENITIIYNSHSGNVGRNRNDAVKISKGQYIAFIDGDDIWCHNKLEIQVKYLNKFGLVCSNVSTIDNNGKILKQFGYSDITNNFELSFIDLIKFNNIITSSVIMKKDLFLELGGFEQVLGIRGEDYVLWLNYAKLYNVFYLSRPLVFYRRHESNLAWKSFEERKLLLLRTINIRYQFINDKNDKIIKAAKDGLIPLYKELSVLFLKNQNYKVSIKYLKYAIKLINKKFSVKYVKYLIFLMVLYLLKIVLFKN